MLSVRASDAKPGLKLFKDACETIRGPRAATAADDQTLLRRCGLAPGEASNEADGVVVALDNDGVSMVAGPGIDELAEEYALDSRPQVHRQTTSGLGTHRSDDAPRLSCRP